MATDRLYIVNAETKEYICIAKSYGNTWHLGNLPELKEYLEINGSSQNLIMGKENDDDFLKAHITDGKNFNTSNKWEYYEPHEDASRMIEQGGVTIIII
jgi:hypothetical protein